MQGVNRPAQISPESAKVYTQLAGLRRFVQDHPDIEAADLRTLVMTLLEGAELLNQTVNDLTDTLKRLAESRGLKV